MITGFEMGLSEVEFWKCSPRVYWWKYEAFVRNELRSYQKQLFTAAISGGAKDVPVYDADFVLKSTRIGQVDIEQTNNVEGFLITEEMQKAMMAKF